MLKNLYKVLTLYYINMTHILKKQTQTDISKFLKLSNLESQKKHLKNAPKYYIMQ